MVPYVEHRSTAYPIYASTAAQDMRCQAASLAGLGASLRGGGGVQVDEYGAGVLEGQGAGDGAAFVDGKMRRLQ